MRMLRRSRRLLPAVAGRQWMWRGSVSVRSMLLWRQGRTSFLWWHGLCGIGVVRCGGSSLVDVRTLLIRQRCRGWCATIAGNFVLCHYRVHLRTFGRCRCMATSNAWYTDILVSSGRLGSSMDISRTITWLST